MATGYDVDKLLEQGRSRWLTNAELLFILENHDSRMIRESVPQLPASGSLFLYDKNINPSFRRDGHKWRKKPSGRVSESHEPLTVHGVKVIECYYATREDNHDFKRRSYWMLGEAKKHIVLVHYRDTNEGKTNSASIVVKSSAGQSCTFTQSVNRFALEDQVGDVSNSQEVEMLPFRWFEEQQATLQQGSGDGIVSGLAVLADQFTWQEIASLFAPSEAEKACFEMPSYGTNPLGCYSMLPHPVPQEAENSSTSVCFGMTPTPDCCYSMLPLTGQVQTPQHKFEIMDISPDWCFANESAKVIIIGSFHCDPTQFAWAVFGDIRVPIQIVQDGVIRCYAPPHYPGKVNFCITFANGELCSEVKSFEYRDKYRLQQDENRIMEDPTLLKVAQRLVSDLLLQKGESSSSSQDRALLTGCGTSSGTMRSILKKHLKDRKGGILIVRVRDKERALESFLKNGRPVYFQDANGWTVLLAPVAQLGREASPKHVKAQLNANNISMSWSDRFALGEYMVELKLIIKLGGVEISGLVAVFVFQEREVAMHTKVDEYGFTSDEIQGLSGAGMRGYKRQKTDTFPQGKAKLVELWPNAEESASLVGTSSTDNDNVDPLQLVVTSSWYFSHG